MRGVRGCVIFHCPQNHLEAMGVAVPANEGWPEGDQFAAYLAKKARRVGTLTAQDLELKRYGSCPALMSSCPSLAFTA